MSAKLTGVNPRAGAAASDDADKQAAEIVKQLAAVVAQFGALAQPASNQIIAAALREKDAEIARLKEALSYVASSSIGRSKPKLDFEQRQKAEEMIEQASGDEDILREFIYELIEARQAAEQCAAKRDDFERRYHKIQDLAEHNLTARERLVAELDQAKKDAEFMSEALDAAIEDRKYFEALAEQVAARQKK